MFWLRTALLYLFVTLLLCAGVWLFWGETILERVKRDERQVRGIEASRRAESVKENAPVRRAVKTADSQTRTNKAATSGKEAWDKASASLAMLLQTAADDNRRLLLESMTEHDSRYRAIFFRQSQRESIRPAEQTLPKSVEQRLPTSAERQLIKSVEQRLPKLAERQPSVRPAK